MKPRKPDEGRAIMVKTAKNQDKDGKIIAIAGVVIDVELADSETTRHL